MAAPVERTCHSIEAGSDGSELVDLVSGQERAPAGASRWWRPAALPLALACGAAGATALWQRHGSTPAVRPGEARLISKQDDQGDQGDQGGQGDQAEYGADTCPCIAIDGLTGNVSVSYEGASFDYPADVGARCNAWDEASDPACTGDTAPSYCGHQWCYVDPCNCQGLEVPPKPSAYFADAMFQGKPVHYSYVTCGGTDEWSPDTAQGADNEGLCDEEADPATYGDSKCQCIGVDGRNGTALVSYGNTTMDFPINLGSRCDAWEKEADPACKDEDPPAYCEMAWCYVDPCACNLSVPSKASSYLPDATHAGKPVHFSYVTCGAEDNWSSEEATAQAAENQDLC